MKKKFLFSLLFSQVLLSCGSSVSYSSLLEKMKSYTDEMVMDNIYLGSFYYEEGFFTDGSVVHLYCNADFPSLSSTSYVFITLPNSATVPNAYYCLYSNESDLVSPSSTSASFYLANTYTRSTNVYFDTYASDYDTIDSDQSLAQSLINLLLTAFNSWIKDELHSSFKTIGLFPNY